MNVIDQVRDNKQVDQQQKKQRQEKRDADAILWRFNPILTYLYFPQTSTALRVLMYYLKFFLK